MAGVCPYKQDQRWYHIFFSYKRNNKRDSLSPVWTAVSMRVVINLYTSQTLTSVNLPLPSCHNFLASPTLARTRIAALKNIHTRGWCYYVQLRVVGIYWLTLVLTFLHNIEDSTVLFSQRNFHMSDHPHTLQTTEEKLFEPFMCPVPTNIIVLLGAVTQFRCLGKKSEVFWKATWRQAYPHFLNFPV